MEGVDVTFYGLEKSVVASVEMGVEEGGPFSEGTGDFVDEGFFGCEMKKVNGNERGGREERTYYH
jgi:hypothetical protein